MKPKIILKAIFISILTITQTSYGFDGHKVVENKNYLSPVSINHVDIVIDIKKDASYEMIVDQTVKLNSKIGVNNFSQMPLSYNAELESMDIISAYTIKTDGSKHMVSKDRIVENSSSYNANVPMFNSNKIKTIIFPDTAVGDKVYVKYKRNVKPLFKGEVSIDIVTPSNISIDKQNVTIKSPNNLDIYSSYSGFSEVTSKNVADGKLKVWTLENHNAISPEPNTAIFIKDHPSIFITSFPSYKAAGEAYLKNHTKKAEISDKISLLAKDITKGIDSDDKYNKAKTIYNWVSQNIRYVALHLKYGGVDPHYASDVLKNRYGDCKDHTVLLEALLKSEGIDSYPVLINLENTYDIPEAPALPGVFNHVITYIPALDIYVDSTTGVAQFGYLPGTLLGKPALSTRNGKLVEIPATPYSKSKNSINIELRSDGNAKGYSTSEQTGKFDILSRINAQNIPEHMRSAAVKRFLQLEQQNGYGNIDYNTPSNLNKPLSLSSTFFVNDVFDSEKSGFFKLPLGVTGFISITPTIFDELVYLENRKTPFVVPNGNFESTWTYKIPNNIDINRVPEDVNFSNGLGTYKAKYSLNDHELNVSRSLFMNTNTTASATAYNDLKLISNAIRKDFNQSVIYNLRK